MEEELFVEIGRVGYIGHGPIKGLPFVIVGILDINRCYIDGAGSGVPRMLISYNDIFLLPHVLKIEKNASTEELKKVVKKEKVYDNYWKSEVGKSFLKAEKTKKLTDFERFKLKLLKEKKEQMIKKALQKYLEEDYKKRKEDYIFAKKICKSHKSLSLRKAKKEQIRYHEGSRQHLLRYRPLIKGMF